MFKKLALRKVLISLHAERPRMVHSSSGLGRRPLTPETRVRLPDALLITLVSEGDFCFYHLMFTSGECRVSKFENH